jgi:hypothetical protein
MQRIALAGIVLSVALVCPAFAAQSDLDIKAELRAIRGDPALVVDLNRALIVGSLVKRWESEFATASMPPGAASDFLYLASAHQLYRAALAESFDAVLAAVNDATSGKGGDTKVVGDAGRDVSYTPVTPCRLVDTRGGFPAVYGGGAFASNEIRTYTMQGGNGVCLAQLPAGLNPAAVQMQVFGIPTTGASGDIEILPQGSSFGSTATMVYVGSIPFNTVSTNAKVNLATNQISIQVRGGGAHLAIDVVGYFKAPTLAPVNSLLRAADFTIFAGNFGTFSTLGCPVGQATISGSCSTSSALNYLTGSYLNVSNGWSCDFTNQSGLNQLVTVNAQCIKIPARAL